MAWWQARGYTSICIGNFGGMRNAKKGADLNRANAALLRDLPVSLFFLQEHDPLMLDSDARLEMSEVLDEYCKIVVHAV